jgi:hypothetical protein
MTQSILQQRIPQSPRTPEHDSGGEEDLKTVHEEAIDRELEAQQNVIDNRYRYRGCNSI